MKLGIAVMTNIRRGSLAFALAALLIWGTLALLRAQTPPLTYAYPDQSIWTTKLDSAGNPENPLLRLAGALFSQAGIPWSSQRYSAGRMFEVLRGGGANFSMLVDAPALKECCLLSKKPVAATELRVYRAATTAAVHSREDLSGKNVILIQDLSPGRGGDGAIGSDCRGVGQRGGVQG